MKVNFWQGLGIVLIIVGVIFYVRKNAAGRRTGRRVACLSHSPIFRRCERGGTRFISPRVGGPQARVVR